MRCPRCGEALCRWVARSPGLCVDEERCLRSSERIAEAEIEGRSVTVHAGLSSPIISMWPLGEQKYASCGYCKKCGSVVIRAEDALPSNLRILSMIRIFDTRDAHAHPPVKRHARPYVDLARLVVTLLQPAYPRWSAVVPKRSRYIYRVGRLIQTTRAVLWRRYLTGRHPRGCNQDPRPTGRNGNLEGAANDAVPQCPQCDQSLVSKVARSAGLAISDEQSLRLLWATQGEELRGRRACVGETDVRSIIPLRSLTGQRYTGCWYCEHCELVVMRDRGARY